MSRSTLRWTSVLLAWVATLAACDPGPLSVGALCGPDDPPGADCRPPSQPPTQNALWILGLAQHGLPDPASVYYHVIMVDLDAGDTVSNRYVSASAVRVESRHERGRYGVEYLGLDPPGEIECTTDQPRREIRLTAGDTVRTDFVFQCAPR